MRSVEVRRINKRGKEKGTVGGERKEEIKEKINTQGVSEMLR